MGILYRIFEKKKASSGQGFSTADREVPDSNPGAPSETFYFLVVVNHFLKDAFKRMLFKKKMFLFARPITESHLKFIFQDVFLNR